MKGIVVVELVSRKKMDKLGLDYKKDGKHRAPRGIRRHKYRLAGFNGETNG